MFLFSDCEYIEGMTLTQHLNQMKLSAFVAIAAVIGGSFLVPIPAQALTDTEKAATAYWKTACDVKHGHVSRSRGGEQAEEYMREIGVSPRVDYADANATTTAEMLDKMAGTNCFQ